MQGISHTARKRGTLPGPWLAQPARDGCARTGHVSECAARHRGAGYVREGSATVGRDAGASVGPIARRLWVAALVRTVFATGYWTEVWHMLAPRVNVECGRGRDLAVPHDGAAAERPVATSSSVRGEVTSVPTDALTISFLGDPVRVVIVGEIDLDTREQFKAALARTFGSDGETVLDLSGVPFMDTHSVTAVVHCANRLFGEGGLLIVHRPPPSLRRIFEVLWGGDGGARLFISEKQQERGERE